MKPKLLIAESKYFSPAARQLLESNFEVIYADLNRQQLLKEIGKYEAVWVRLRTLIDSEMFAAAAKLRVLATNTTGLTHIDLSEAANRHVQIVSLKGEVDFLRHIRATAELTIGLTLAVIRQIPRANQHAMAGGWERDLFRGTEIYEETIGIVGYGRLGKIVASYFAALGATVLVNDPKLENQTSVDSFEVLPLDSLLARSRIVSLHANSTPENRCFFGKQQFDCMQHGAIFLNTARGELVDEQSMLEATASGKLGGLGVDVISSEHSEGSMLTNLRLLASQGFNIVVTPHIGGNTVESLARTEKFIAERLVNSFSKCNLEHV